MNKQLEKVIDIMTDDYLDKDKAYIIMGAEFVWANWDITTEFSWSYTVNELIIFKHRINKHDSQSTRLSGVVTAT